MFDSFLVALNAIMPTFLLLAFGYFLKHKNFVSSEFLKQTNTLTFKFFLPFLLFNNIYKTEITEAIDGMTFTIAVGSLLFLFAVLCIVVPRVVREPKQRGVIIQGLFRSNYVIFGVSLVTNVFGAEAALVRTTFVNGTHAIACALYGALQPGDTILAVTGGEDVIADAVPAAEVTETSYMGSASEFAKVLPDRMSATAVSEEEAAANAAQAIFSIRKHRMDLITGEAGENVFGAGLKDALAALDAAEQEYLELFFGKRVVTTSVERVVIPMIEGVQSYAVARISSSAGVIAADAKDGDAVTLEVAPSGRARLSSIVEADPKSKTAVKVRVADPSTCTVTGMIWK